MQGGRTCGVGLEDRNYSSTATPIISYCDWTSRVWRIPRWPYCPSPSPSITTGQPSTNSLTSNPKFRAPTFQSANGQRWSRYSSSTTIDSRLATRGPSIDDCCLASIEVVRLYMNQRGTRAQDLILQNWYIRVRLRPKQSVLY